MKGPGNAASRAKFEAAYNHNLRTNEDGKGYEHLLHPELTQYNRELVSDTLNKTYTEIADDRVADMDYYKDHKVRSNAVYMVELVLNYNRDTDAEGRPLPCILDIDMKERERWEQVNLKWLRDTFRDPVTGKDNVVGVSVHYDESSPHMHVMIVPESDGHLNQNVFFSRDKFFQLQRDYGDLMGKEFGLKKSRQFSKAQQMTMKAFHSGLEMRYNGKEFEYLDERGNKRNPIEELALRDGETPAHQADRIKQFFGEYEAVNYKKELNYKKEIANLKTDIQHPDLAIQRKIGNAKNRSDYLEREMTSLAVTAEKQAALITDIQNVLQNEPDPSLAMEKINILIRQDERMMQEFQRKEKEKKEQLLLEERRKEHAEEEKEEQEAKAQEEKTEKEKKKKHSLLHGDER